MFDHQLLGRPPIMKPHAGHQPYERPAFRRQGKPVLVPSTGVAKMDRNAFVSVTLPAFPWEAPQ